MIGAALAAIVALLAVKHLDDKRTAEVAKSEAAKKGENAKHSADENGAKDVPGGRPAVSARSPAAPPGAPSRTTRPVPVAPNEAPDEPASPAREEDPGDKPAAKTAPGTSPNMDTADEPVIEPKPKAGAKPETRPAAAAGAKEEERREAVPDEAAHARALKLLDDTYQEELGKAKTAAQKTSLAHQMLGKAEQIDDDPAGRFVLVEKACALAKESNDLDTALEAVDAMTRRYALDAWSTKANLLAEMAKGVRTAAQHRAVIERAILMSRQAADMRQYAIAAKLSQLAVTEATKAREFKVAMRARALAKESSQALEQFRQYEAAKDKLREEPGNAEANLTAGRFECLVWGEWDRGLGKLAACSDATLRNLASKDLGKPADADEQAAQGDGWWELAKDESGIAQVNLYRRAGWWYEKALSQAPGC